MNQIIYHNPPHLYIDETVYIITASTINKQKYLNTDVKRQMLQKTIYESIKEIKYEIFAWVILENHYHLLLKVANGNLLGKLINLIHGRSSFMINGLEKRRGRKIWYSYWDSCVRNENDFYVRFNYIHNNPIKHGYMRKFENLFNYEFSSYPYYLKTKGQEWINDLFMRYPIINFMNEYDDY